MWHPIADGYRQLWSSNIVRRVVTWLFAGMQREFKKQNGKCPDSETWQEKRKNERVSTWMKAVGQTRVAASCLKPAAFSCQCVVYFLSFHVCVSTEEMYCFHTPAWRHLIFMEKKKREGRETSAGMVLSAYDYVVIIKPTQSQKTGKYTLGAGSRRLFWRLFWSGNQGEHTVGSFCSLFEVIWACRGILHCVSVHLRTWGKNKQLLHYKQTHTDLVQRANTLCYLSTIFLLMY